MDEFARKLCVLEDACVLCRHLNVVADHVVVADFQVLDRHLFAVTRLQIGDDLSRVITQRPRRIKLLFVTRRNEVAITRHQGQVLAEPLFKLMYQHVGNLFDQLRGCPQVGSQPVEVEKHAYGLGASEAVAYGCEVTGAASPQNKASQRPFEVRHGFQLLPHALA